jgi:NTE family protein
MKNGKRAIVLSGGGTRGAYEIGVWQALKELSIDYQIVTGTSIGSINGALMTMGDLEESKRIWQNMVMEDLMQAPPKPKGFFGALFEKLFPTKLSERGKLLDGAVNNSPFLDFIEKNIDEEKIRSSAVRYGLVTVRAKDRKGLHLPVEEIPKGLLKDYIIASSSVYPVFPMHKIEGIYYIDGTYSDNLPIDLAISMGATELIVVDLQPKPQHPKYAGKSNILYLTPSESLGGILEFDRTQIEAHIEMGYKDAMQKFTLLRP